VDQAEERMRALGDPLAMFDHAYAERPPHLEAQRRELAAELEHGAEGEGR
jgi:pyruvate dehydrogenase E1 component alpha subunit